MNDLRQSCGVCEILLVEHPSPKHLGDGVYEYEFHCVKCRSAYRAFVAFSEVDPGLPPVVVNLRKV